jgi:sugar phosphate isomerase/epimerase
MRIGLCAWSFTGAHREAGCAIDPHEPEGLARLASSSGLASIETAVNLIAERQPAERAAFRHLLEQSDLGLVLDTGSDTLASDQAPLLAAIDTAAELGARVVRTTISGVLEGDRRSYGGAGWHTHLTSLVEPLKRVMAAAEPAAVSVGIENHQDLCSRELVWLCEQVGSPLLGVTMDCANALAVGETPENFAITILPHLKHVHLKDYRIYPTPSGFRFSRCPLGSGVVNWLGLLEIFSEAPDELEACIELGASAVRHIRILEADYWETFRLGDPFPNPPFDVALDAIRQLHRAARPVDEDWRTPHEREEPAAACAAYELQQFESSVSYLREIQALTPLTERSK